MASSRTSRFRGRALVCAAHGRDYYYAIEIELMMVLMTHEAQHQMNKLIMGWVDARGTESNTRQRGNGTVAVVPHSLN